MSNRKILVLKGDSSKYSKPFTEWGKITTDVGKLEDCDLVVFTGGTDVNPSLYGQVSHPETGSPDTQRDKLEQAVYTRALLLELPMVGICRGAQFLTVMNNGSLHQHIIGHQNTTHTINTHNGESLQVAGDHHQSMRPEGVHEILAISPDGVPEVVYWPLTRSLAVQFHPEWMDVESEGYQYFQNLLDMYVM